MFRNLILIISVIFLQACETNNQNFQSTMDNLKGDWLSPCYLFAGNNTGDYTGTFILSFEDGQYHWNIVYFSDFDCLVPRNEYRNIVGTYSINGVVDTDDGRTLDRLILIETSIDSDSTFDFSNELKGFEAGFVITENELTLGWVHSDTGIAVMENSKPLIRM